MSAIDRPTLDLTHLESITNGDDEFRNELIETFLDESPDMVAGLSIALGADDGNSLRRGAHTLTGSSANFGAAALGAACRELEQAAQDGNATADQIERVRTLYDLVDKALREVLAS